MSALAVIGLAVRHLARHGSLVDEIRFQGGLDLCGSASASGRIARRVLGRERLAAGGRAPP